MIDYVENRSTKSVELERVNYGFIERASMAQWKIKEFAQVTQVTIRTLHHYDQIGLLKPSFRQDNGYRMYTDKDLVQLQQILALKFFGFDLQQIQKLVKKENFLMASLQVQVELLQEKITMLTQAHANLQMIIASNLGNDQFAWEQIIESMKVYKTMEHTEQLWVTRFLDQQELQEYAALAHDLEQRFGKDYGTIAGQQWQKVVEKVKQHLHENPLSQSGRDAALACMEFVRTIYGKKYAHLSRIIWEKGFKGNKIKDQFAMTPEMIAWLDQAIDGYYGFKIQQLLLSIRDVITPELQDAWQNIIDEMSGAHRQITQKSVIHDALLMNEQYPVEQQITSVAIAWLKSMIK